LLDWDHSYLYCKISEERNCPLLHVFLLFSSDLHFTKEELIVRFQTLVEAGMSHYPKEIGFLFHEFSKNTANTIHFAAKKVRYQYLALQEPRNDVTFRIPVRVAIQVHRNDVPFRIRVRFVWEGTSHQVGKRNHSEEYPGTTLCPSGIGSCGGKQSGSPNGRSLFPLSPRSNRIVPCVYGNLGKEYLTLFSFELGFRRSEDWSLFKLRFLCTFRANVEIINKIKNVLKFGRRPFPALGRLYL
jgi:hypothetical protein